MSNFFSTHFQTINRKSFYLLEITNKQTSLTIDLWHVLDCKLKSWPLQHLTTYNNSRLLHPVERKGTRISDNNSFACITL